MLIITAMKMFRMAFLGFALLGVAANGFATPTQPWSPELLAGRGIPPVLAAKMQNRAPLTLEEIGDLGRLRVPDDVKLAYLRATGANYELSTENIDRLRANGVSDSVVDYLL